MTENQSSLCKAGYKWQKVSEMFLETPPVDAHCQTFKRFPGYQGLWCRLIMAVTSFAQMKNSVAIIHGPSNCAWAVRNFCQTNYCLYYGNPFLHMPTTNINQDDIISGGTEKLIKTILEVDKDYNPEFIVIFDTCSTALIGDDIETTIKTVQSQIKSRINYISSAGFLSPPLGKSIQEITVEYVKLMEPPKKILPDTINILGQYKEQSSHFCSKNGQDIKKCYKKDLKHENIQKKYPDDAFELSRMLEGIGLKIHRILISGDLEYIKTAPEAAFNIISCPTWGIPLAKSMKEHFGTQYSKQSVPVGISATKKWLREIAILSGKVEQAEKFINEEIKQLESLFNKTKNFTKGVIALIECGRNSQTAFARPMALARALEELEMIPVLFGLHPLELKAKQVDYEYFMSEKFDPIILNGNYAYQQSININHIIEDLGLKDYIYFTQDIFPLSRAGIFDETRVPRVETSVHLRRIINAPGRGIGFTGSKALYESILESLKISSKKSKSTLYARVHGKFYEKF